MNELQLYNTLTARKEPFQPLNPPHVDLYVCGITPYDETHLGHARCYVVFDLLKRVLQGRGFAVRHVQNFTDIDDKIIERANKTGAPALSYAEPFIESFHKWMKMLNVKPADAYPRVTQHIPGIISLIEKLVAKDLAYVSAGTVYYAVRRFAPYGRLSKRKLDDLEAGGRVEVDENKKDPLDFALWKGAKPGEPSWPSPWGLGRPGWHIECSAMSMALLGEEFDIHGGGLDLIFPHHENEVAQSVGATGRAFAHTWVHNGFVTVNHEKMSKSLGNFFTLKDILAKFDPMVVRYFLLSQHYRSPLNFSDHELKSVESAWTQRVCGAYKIALGWERKIRNHPADAPVESSLAFKEFMEALLNDLNTSGALGVLNQICSDILQLDAMNPTKEGDVLKFYFHRRLLNAMFDVLGLNLPVESDWDPEALALASQREEARKSRNWSEADRLRKELAQRGIVVEDTPSGPRLKRASRTRDLNDRSGHVPSDNSNDASGTASI